MLGGISHASTGLMRALWKDGDTCDLAWRGSPRDDIVLTRAARRFFRVPRTSAPDLDTFGAALLDRATTGDYDVVIPMGDWETWLVVTHADELAPHVGLLTPERDVFELANDKAAVMAHARSLGIATPQVWDWPGAPDLATLPPDVRFPVVVKARLGSGVHRGLRYAMDPPQLREAYQEIAATEAHLPTEDFTRPLIMEFIPGFVHDADAVARDGEVINVCTNVRQVMTPIEGGAGAVIITTDEPAGTRPPCSGSSRETRSRAPGSWPRSRPGWPGGGSPACVGVVGIPPGRRRRRHRPHGCPGASSTRSTARGIPGSEPAPSRTRTRQGAILALRCSAWRDSISASERRVDRRRHGLPHQPEQG